MELVGLLLCAVAFASPALDQSVTSWRPSEAQLRELETAIQLPATYPRLSEYTRYYVVYGSNGRHIISGELLHVPPYKPGIYVVRDESKFPPIADGGCDVMHISYDFDVHSLISRPKCNPIR